ncbi:MAG: hypothetical protein RLZZ584_3165 [Pseudomonadota bacterium]
MTAMKRLPVKSPSSRDSNLQRRQRRSVLGALAGSLVLTQLPALAPVAQAAEPAGAEPPRLALLIGNRDYPDGEDLPPIHKNVRDLKAALERRGFAVTEALDLDLQGARSVVRRFSQELQAAPPDATVFFYFSGHGAQVDAKNLLVSARLSPKASTGRLLDGSMTLATDIVSQIGLRPRGLTMAVIDACRTSLTASVGNDGLNQVEAPPGCLIAFATGAGKPAIAPIDEKRNTFYTASLVRLLDSAPDEITFSDLFRLVKADVQQTMLNHPVALLRQLAQVPFIAENLRQQRKLAVQGSPGGLAARRADAGARTATARDADAGAPTGPAAGTASGASASGAGAPSPIETESWEQIEHAIWPAEIVKLARDYLRRFPDSALALRAQVARDGAIEAARILARQDVRLYRSAFQATVDMPVEQQRDLPKAGRGDKDAAARLGRWYVDRPAGQRSRSDLGRYEGWMQYAAALGNGIASYELALYYRRADQAQLASQYETRARELGYTPPPSLDNTRK